MEKESVSLKENSTRENLLDVAERLFSERGYENTCIRDVTEAAGVNVASVNYHFQGKENLYLEIFRRRIALVRHDHLADFESFGEGTSMSELSSIVETFVQRFLGTHLGTNSSEYFMQLCFREVSQPGPAFDLVVQQMILPVQTALRAAIRRARPHLSEEDVTLSVISIVGQVVHFVRARRVVTRLTGKEYTPEFLARIARHITDFSLGGLGGAA